MTYKKILVDNTTCLRRFHISFDEADQSQESVELKCLHCGEVVFAKQNHAPAKLIREENLVKTTDLSSLRMKNCAFKDSFSVASQPKK